MSSKGNKIIKTPTQALAILWEEGFFKVWKKLPDIESHLAKRGTNFLAPGLGMALGRARHLTRKGRPGSYEYIQKHPFESKTVKEVAANIKKRKR